MARWAAWSASALFTTHSLNSPPTHHSPLSPPAAAGEWRLGRAGRRVRVRRRGLLAAALRAHQLQGGLAGLGGGEEGRAGGREGRRACQAP